MRNLNLHALAQFSKCSSIYQDLCRPSLYQSLHIKLQRDGPCRSSRGMMRALIQRPSIFCPYLRHIHVSGSSLVPHPIVETVAIMLEYIMQTLNLIPGRRLISFIWQLPLERRLRIACSIPRTIQHLALEGSMIDERLDFPFLIDLQCTSYLTIEQTAWLRSHLKLNQLKRLSLGANVPGHVGDSKPEPLMPLIPVLAHSDASLLTHLRLDSINLDTWPFCRLPNLKVLEIYRCLHVRSALSTFRAWNPEPRLLTRLRMTVSTDSLDLPAFIDWLVQHACFLEELSLLISGCQALFPLDSIMKYGKHLSVLVIESRKIAAIPCTAFFYRFSQFAGLIQALTNLTHLAIPLYIGSFSEQEVGEQSLEIIKREFEADFKKKIQLRVFNFLSSHGPNQRRKSMTNSRTIARFLRLKRLIVVVDEAERYRWMIRKPWETREHYELEPIHEPVNFPSEHKWFLY